MLLIQGLLEALFHQSVLVQFAIFLAVGLVVYAIACGFLVVCNRRQARPAEWIPVAPFATSITTLFGLFLAFRPAAVARRRPAHRAAQRGRPSHRDVVVDHRVRAGYARPHRHRGGAFRAAEGGLPGPGDLRLDHGGGLHCARHDRRPYRYLDSLDPSHRVGPD